MFMIVLINIIFAIWIISIIPAVIMHIKNSKLIKSERYTYVNRGNISLVLGIISCLIFFISPIFFKIVVPQSYGEGFIMVVFGVVITSFVAYMIAWIGLIKGVLKKQKTLLPIIAIAINNPIVLIAAYIIILYIL